VASSEYAPAGLARSQLCRELAVSRTKASQGGYTYADTLQTGYIWAWVLYVPKKGRTGRALEAVGKRSSDGKYFENSICPDHTTRVWEPLRVNSLGLLGFGSISILLRTSKEFPRPSRAS
jgi:hypothetical protein